MWVLEHVRECARVCVCKYLEIVKKDRLPCVNFTPKTIRVLFCLSGFEVVGYVSILSIMYWCTECAYLLYIFMFLLYVFGRLWAGEWWQKIFACVCVRLLCQFHSYNNTMLRKRKKPSERGRGRDWEEKERTNDWKWVWARGVPWPKLTISFKL